MHVDGTKDMLLFQVQEGGRTSLMTCLLEGPSGSGKTALAASLGIDSNLPFVKVITSANMMGFSESAKGAHITKIIEDAYRVSHHFGHMKLACDLLYKQNLQLVARPLSQLVAIQKFDISYSHLFGASYTEYFYLSRYTLHSCPKSHAWNRCRRLLMYATSRLSVVTLFLSAVACLPCHS